MTTLTIEVPVALDEDIVVQVKLFEAPADDLQRELTELKFYSLRYTDIQQGRAPQLDGAFAAAKAHGNSIWSTTVPFPQGTRSIIGDLLTHAQMFQPDAHRATLRDVVQIVRDATVRRIGDRWVTWGTAIIDVT